MQVAGDWIEQARFLASNGVNGDHLGVAVAIGQSTSTGQWQVVAGADRREIVLGPDGRAFVFELASVDCDGNGIDDDSERNAVAGRHERRGATAASVASRPTHGPQGRGMERAKENGPDSRTV